LAIATFKSLNRLGIDGPKVTAARIAQVPGIAAEARADTAINSNPITAPDVIQTLKDKINPKKFEVINKASIEARSKAQALNADQLSQQIDDSPDHTIEPAMLKGWRDAKKITDSQYDRLNSRMKNYTAQEAKEQTDEMYKAMQQARDTDWVTDPNPQKTAKDLKELGLGWKNPALRLKLNEYIDREMASAKKWGESTERPVERQVLDQMKQDREKDSAFLPMTPEKKGESHWYGNEADTPSQHVPGGVSAIRKMTPEQIKDTFGEKATKESVLEAEKAHAGEMFIKMQEWFKDPANKDADYEKANAYRQTLEKPYVMDSVKQSLLKDHPVAITSEEEFNQLPSGASFIYNGRVGTKK